MEEARKNYLRALRISLGAKSTLIALDSLLGLAHLQTQAGKPEHALEISFHVLKYPDITRETRESAIEIKDEAKKMLTDNQIQAIKENVLDKPIEEFAKQFLGE